MNFKAISKSNFKYAETNPIKASIVIPTLNEKFYIENALKVFLRQKYNNLEIIVVDGGSTDGTQESVKNLSSEYPNIQLIVHKKSSPSEARNIGCKEAHGDVVVFMDADIAGLSDKFIEKTLTHFADENVIGVHPVGVRTMDTWLERVLYHQKECTTPSFDIYPLLMRRDLFINLGGFPTIGFGEDKILAKNVRNLILQSPKRIVIENDAFYYVHGPHTLREFWNQQRWYGRTFPLYAAKAGLDLEASISFYLNALLSFSTCFILFISHFPILIINLIPLFFSFILYLFNGIKNSNLRISLCKFLLILVGGFAKCFGLLEYLLGKKRIGR